jgi:hypothetical protein
MRAVTTKTHNYVFNIDRKYPGYSVDGWGFISTLDGIDSKFWVRPEEELYQYKGLNSILINDDELKVKLAGDLLDYSQRFNDPLHRYILRQLKKIKLI